jgi:hypothetical protein
MSPPAAHPVTALLTAPADIERAAIEAAECLHQLDLALAAHFRAMRDSHHAIAATLGVARPRRDAPRPLPGPPAAAGEASAAACDPPAPRAMRPASPAVGTSLPTGGGGLEG